MQAVLPGINAPRKGALPEDRNIIIDAVPIQRAPMRMGSMPLFASQCCVGGSGFHGGATDELGACDLIPGNSPQPAAGDKAIVQSYAEAAAGVKQQLQKNAARIPGLRLLSERFMAINQAMGIPVNRSDEALACLTDFNDEMKAGGFIADALQRHYIAGAAVAAPGYPVDQQAWSGLRMSVRKHRFVWARQADSEIFEHAPAIRIRLCLTSCRAIRTRRHACGA